MFPVRVVSQTEPLKVTNALHGFEELSGISERPMIIRMPRLQQRYDHLYSAIMRGEPSELASRGKSLETVFVMKPTENRFGGHTVIARDPMPLVVPARSPSEIEAKNSAAEMDPTNCLRNREQGPRLRHAPDAHSDSM